MAIVLTVNDKHFEHKLGEHKPLKMAGTTSFVINKSINAPFSQSYITFQLSNASTGPEDPTDPGRSI